jgi:hypothetical protein
MKRENSGYNFCPYIWTYVRTKIGNYKKEVRTLQQQQSIPDRLWFFFGLASVSSILIWPKLAGICHFLPRLLIKWLTPRVFTCMQKRHVFKGLSHEFDISAFLIVLHKQQIVCFQSLGNISKFFSVGKWGNFALTIYTFCQERLLPARALYTFWSCCQMALISSIDICQRIDLITYKEAACLTPLKKF